MKGTGLLNLLVARGVYILFQIPMASLHTGFKAKTDANAIKIEWIKLCKKKKVTVGNKEIPVQLFCDVSCKKLEKHRKYVWYMYG